MNDQPASVSDTTAQLLHNPDAALTHLATGLAHALRVVVGSYLLAHLDEAEAVKPLLTDPQSILEIRSLVRAGEMTLEVLGHPANGEPAALLFRQGFLTTAAAQAKH